MKHNWRLIVCYKLSDSEQELLDSGIDIKMILTSKKVDNEHPPQVGCIVCEHQFNDANYECPGHPAGYGLDGEPMHTPDFAPKGTDMP